MNKDMGKNKLVLIAVIIGVICAAYFIYSNHNKKVVQEANPPVDRPPVEEEHLFPAPGKTVYQMSLYLDINTRSIYGTTILTTVNTSERILSDLVFTIYPDAFRQADSSPAPAPAYYAGFDAGWIDIDGIMINGKMAEYHKEGVSMQVIVPEPIKKGQDLRVEMKWRTRVPKAAYRFGYSDQVYMLGNFYPVLNVADRGGWLTTYNSAFGDPFCFHSADYLVGLNIPENYGMVSTGAVIERSAEDTGRQDYLIVAENARDFCLGIMYDYNGMYEYYDDLLITVVSPPGHEKQMESVLKQAADIIDYYSKTWGPYPYNEFKIAFVPMKGFHGMEYSGLIFLQDAFLGSTANQQRSEFILAHEIAHQWWYGVVGNDQIREPWLDEGLANWGAYKYLAGVRGKKITPPTEESVNLARELSDMYSTREYYHTAYTGGESFWFGLEEELGTEKVNRVLQRYYSDYQFRIANSSNLLDTIREEAGRDMEYYFNEWFY